MEKNSRINRLHIKIQLHWIIKKGTVPGGGEGEQTGMRGNRLVLVLRCGEGEGMHRSRDL